MPAGSGENAITTASSTATHSRVGIWGPLPEDAAEQANANAILQNLDDISLASTMGLDIGESVGEFITAEDALSALRKEFDKEP